MPSLERLALRNTHTKHASRRIITGTDAAHHVAREVREDEEAISKMVPPPPFLLVSFPFGPDDVDSAIALVVVEGTAVSTDKGIVESEAKFVGIGSGSNDDKVMKTVM